MKNMYDFSKFGHVMSYKTKLLKHRNANNHDRCVDYLLQGYTDYPADKGLKNHPCYDVIEDVGRGFLKPLGIRAHRVKIDEHYQLEVIYPNGYKCYSNYIYGDNKEIDDYNRLQSIGKRPVTEKEYEMLISNKNNVIEFFNNNSPREFGKNKNKNIIDKVMFLKKYSWSIKFIKTNKGIQLEIKGYKDFNTWVSNYKY